MSSTKISVKELSQVVLDELENYRDLAVEEMNKAVKDAGDTVKKEISQRASSLFKGDKYYKSWAVKETNKITTGIEVTVHSPKEYRIAHLLENGHAKRGGGRVEGRPHIAPAEEIGEKQLEEDLRKALEGK